MKTDAAIKLIEKWSVGYIKMDCEEGKCYGVLAVRSFSAQSLDDNSVVPKDSPHLFCIDIIPFPPRSACHWRKRYAGQTSRYTEWVRFVIQ